MKHSLMYMNMCSNSVYYEHSLAVYKQDPVNPMSDDNKNLRRYAELLSESLRYLEACDWYFSISLHVHDKKIMGFKDNVTFKFLKPDCMDSS